MKANKCEFCDKTLDAHTTIGARQTPEPGDLTVCIYCATIGTFDKEGNITSLSRIEIEKFPIEIKTTVERAQKEIRKRIRRN